MAYPWPGNVRQLRNVIENMVVLATSERLTLDDLPPDFAAAVSIAPAQRGCPPAAARRAGRRPVGISIQDAEKELIRNTLKMVAGNREQAAKHPRHRRADAVPQDQGIRDRGVTARRRGQGPTAFSICD